MQIVSMVRMIDVDKSEPAVIATTYNNLKLGTITSDIVGHLVYDQPYIGGRRHRY